MRIKSGSTYREGYRDGVSCAQWLQLVSSFVYLLIAHPKAPLWPVGSECTFPAPSPMSRHNNGIQRKRYALARRTLYCQLRDPTKSRLIFHEPTRRTAFTIPWASSGSPGLLRTVSVSPADRQP